MVSKIISVKGASILLGMLIFYVFFQNCTRSVDPDLGWHLRIGHQIIEEKNVPRYDNMSYTMPGYAWIDHEWLVETLFAYAENFNFWLAVQIAFSVLAFLPFFFWLKRAEEHSELVPIFAGAILIAPYISVRPQIITLVLFFALAQVVFSANSRKYSLSHGKMKFILPILFFAWSNLHAGFFSGIIFLSAYIVAKFFLSKFIVKNPYPNLRSDMLVFVACLLVTLINPYGIDIYREIFQASTSRLTLDYVLEWHPAFTSANMLRHAVLIGIFLGTMPFFQKKNIALAIILSLVFLVIGIRSNRMMPFFAITSVEMLTKEIGRFTSGLRKFQHYYDKKSVLIRKVFFVFIMSFFCAIFLGYFDIKSGAASYPSKKSLQFLSDYQALHADMKIFNEYSWGGYISYHLPTIKLFIDGRMPHWKQGDLSAMNDYIDSYYKLKWEDVFDKYDIDLVFLKNNSQKSIANPGPYQRLYAYLLTDQQPNQKNLVDSLTESGWIVLYEDSSVLSLGKKTP